MGPSYPPKVIFFSILMPKEDFLKCAVLGVMVQSGNSNTWEAQVEANQDYVARCCAN